MATARSLSPTGLRALDDAMEAFTASGEIPGIVTVVARGDEVHVGTHGVMDLASGQPMRRDAIFRVASLTKPVIAVAVLMLLEDGALRMDDPVERWLPELADRRVLRRIDGPLDDTVPANRPITVEDLMTMRAGYGAVMVFPSQYPIQHEVDARGISPGPYLPAIPPDEWLGRFADLPLLHQPGEKWHYDTASNMLAILISRVTGAPLSAFLRERIFAPLEMRDTAFFVPPEKAHRLPTCYAADDATGALEAMDFSIHGGFTRPPVFESGSGGLVTTVDDFLIFGRMLLNGGEYYGTRLLSTASVAAMTRDHVTREQKDRSPFFPGFWDHAGWGYGVEVTVVPDGTSPLPGHYGWVGGYGPAWRNHPATGVTGIVMAQRLFSEPLTRMHAAFFSGAFGSAGGATGG